MMKSDEIIIDSKSGISVEEQKEILSEINGIAESNRRALAESQGEKKSGKPVIKAKRSTAIFPLIVNIAAVAILAGGGFFLVSLNETKDAQIRTGSAVYNHMERALIEEIRSDTAAKIAAKESEITLISSRLQEVDTELIHLFSLHQELTAEQLAAQERLLSLQNTYRSDLTNLRDERSQILEDSRSREARLRTQLEERTKEFTAAEAKASGELDSVKSELGRLTSEQDRIASIDAQLAGSLPAVSALIQNGNYNQAAQAVSNMKRLFSDSAFSSARAYQSKREFYNSAINFMELVINEGEKNSISFAITSRNLQSQNTQLEGTITEMQGAIESISADSENQARRIADLEQTVSSLRATNATLQSNVSSMRTANTAQQATITELNETVRDFRGTNATQQAEILRLTQLNTTQQGEISRLTQTSTTLTQTNTTQQGEISRLTQTNAAQQGEISRLTQTSAAQQVELSRLTQTNTAQQGEISRLTQTNAAQQGEISRLTQANTTQQEEISRLTQTNSRLQATNNSQAQEIANIRKQIDDLREIQ